MSQDWRDTAGILLTLVGVPVASHLRPGGWAGRYSYGTLYSPPVIAQKKWLPATASHGVAAVEADEVVIVAAAGDRTNWPNEKGAGRN